MKNMGRVACILALAGSTLALSSCTKKDNADAKGQVFRAALRDDVKTLDPANAYDSVSLDVLPNIVEPLYQYDYSATEFKLIPQLAADMPTYSKDRLTVTVPIKRGVMFSDDACFKSTNGKGRELKAQDFIYAFKRLGHPSIQSAGQWIFDGRVVGFSEFTKKLTAAPKDQLAKTFEETSIEGMKALDDYTIQIKLTRPYPQLIYMLSMSFAAPVAQEVIAGCADERAQLNDKAVGTGAFKLVKWDRGHEIVLERNPQYRGDPMPAGVGADSGKVLPFLDRLVFVVIKEDQPAWLNFLKGEIDTGRIPKDNFGQAIAGGKGREVAPELKEKGIKLDVVPGPVAYWVNFNVKDKVLSNKYLRQAMSSAINREKWIELFTNGRGHKQDQVAPPGLVDRVANSTLKYDFNLERAKELLKKAGYPEGKGLPTITMDMRGADSTNRQLGDFLTQQFAQIGVKLNVVYNTFPAFLEKSKNNQFQLSYGGWYLDYPDVENMYQLLYGKNVAPGPNDANFTDPRFDKLYEQMSSMDPGPARAKVVKQMDDLVQEETPWAFGFFRDEFTLYHGWIANYRGNAFIRDGWKYYRVDQDLKQQLVKNFKKK